MDVAVDLSADLRSCDGAEGGPSAGQCIMSGHSQAATAAVELMVPTLLEELATWLARVKLEKVAAVAWLFISQASLNEDPAHVVVAQGFLEEGSRCERLACGGPAGQEQPDAVVRRGGFIETVVSLSRCNFAARRGKVGDGTRCAVECRWASVCGQWGGEATWTNLYS